MQAGIELKYILLFAILIALTGFSFESQIDNKADQSGIESTSIASSKTIP